MNTSFFVITYLLFADVLTAGNSQKKFWKKIYGYCCRIASGPLSPHPSGHWPIAPYFRKTTPENLVGPASFELATKKL